MEHEKTPPISPPRRTAPQLLTVEAVRSRLQCSRAMAYGLISGGALPSVRIGRALRVSEDDLAAFIACRRESTQSTDY